VHSTSSNSHAVDGVLEVEVATANGGDVELGKCGDAGKHGVEDGLNLRRGIMARSRGRRSAIRRVGGWGGRRWIENDGCGEPLETVGFSGHQNGGSHVGLRSF
jgi:hypothetical protein